MKKAIFAAAILVSLALLAAGCQGRYKNGIDVPADYPDELEIYDDAIVFETAEENNKITLFYGTDDDIEDVSEFYGALMQSLQLICSSQDEGRHEYSAEGIGSCYDFEIRAEEAEGKEKKYYDTVVEVTVKFDQDSTELKEKLQGNWMYSGQDGQLFSYLNRSGMYYSIDDNSYMYYENFISELSETYVFFMDDNTIVTKSEAGTTEPYEIAFEEIAGTQVMTMLAEGYPPQHFSHIKNSELDSFKQINETWNKMKGFWQRVGSGGKLGDEYRDLAYNFSDYHFDVYIDGQSTTLGVLYDFVDADTIEHDFGNKLTTANIIFETIDGVDVMTLQYDDAVMHFEKTTLEDYRLETAQTLSADTLGGLQGLWYLVGKEGQITEDQKALGFAYEFTDNEFDTYNNYIMTNFDTEFAFIDEDTFEYTTSTGDIVSVDISFEQIDGIDVMTYTVYSTEYHFIKVTYEEFLAYQTQYITQTKEQMQGFWYMVGSGGEISEDSKNLGFAYKFTENKFTSYSNYHLGSKNVEYSFIDGRTISYKGADGTQYTAQIKFETVEGVDVMTYTYNATDYHFVKTTYEEYMKNADLSQVAIGFWVMIGSDGALSDEVKAEGNAIEFTEDMMTTYMDYAVSLQTSDYEITDDTVIYNFGTGSLKARITFKTVDNEDVLCAVILGQEYYFELSSYEAFMAGS
ncbi:MAG: hypothetical protein JXN65_07605 [Clostridia bacterium]|nr:hypothetical protein [Clostridia bacterium]